MNIKHLVLMIVAALGLSAGSFYAVHYYNQVQEDKIIVQKKAEEAAPERLMARAGWLMIEGDVTEAKALYRRVYQSAPDTIMSKIAEARLVEEGYEDYFYSLDETNSSSYEVQNGDTLSRIASQYGVTAGLVRVSNRIKGDRIRPFQKLKIMQDKWRILVDKSTNILILKAGDRVVKTYPVGTGKRGNTPLGDFEIVNRLKDPTWYYEGIVAQPGTSENPLGTRWMGFNIDGYGLHGTTDPASIGKYETLGCIRMYNADVEELFEIVPTGTKVSVFESAADLSNATTS